MRISRPLLLCLVLASFALVLTAITPSKTAPRSAPVDSSRVDTLKVEVHVIDSSARRSLDSMRREFKRRPVREIIRILPGANETTPGSVVEVPEQVVRETADSLETCRFDRDSTARQVTIWQARTAAQDEARRLCEAKPAPEVPSRSTWAAIGAGAATAAIAALLLLAR